MTPRPKWEPLRSVSRAREQLTACASSEVSSQRWGSWRLGRSRDPSDALAVIDAEVRRRWDDLMVAGHPVSDREREEWLREWSARAAEVVTSSSRPEE